MVEPVELFRQSHPNDRLQSKYENLIGLDSQKKSLLSNLQLILNDKSLKDWQAKHHEKGLSILGERLSQTPLVILAGDVGCGKTELATCVGTPLVSLLGNPSVFSFQAPTDIRGGGLVGELSARITASFNDARRQLKKNQFGILILDEADSLAESREEGQQHREDKAGVNALIQEIDRIEKDQVKLAVIFITNRLEALDPAIRRRAVVEIEFARPSGKSLDAVIETLVKDIEPTEAEMKELSESCKAQSIPYTYSDFYRRIAKQTILKAWESDQPYSADLLIQTIQETKPSPQFLNHENS